MTEVNKRTQIKNAAAKLFRKKGYRATSMQDIADALGIKAASLYNHIKSKQEILTELLMNIALAFTAGMDDIRNSCLDENSQLEELVNLHVNLTFKYKDSIALITGEWVHLDPEILPQYLEKRNNYEEAFMAILESCQKKKLISESTNLDIALFSILSSLHWLYNWHNKNPDLGKIEVAAQLKKILLHGLISPKK